MDISIIILNYRSKGLVLNCIKSVKEADFGDLNYEIIVVDNDSDDSIGEILAWQHPEVKFIQSMANIGMGAGNNLGIKQAMGKYTAIMNPDTIAFKDTFLILYEYMEKNYEVGLAGPMQFNPDKTVQDTSFRWFNILTPIYRRTPLGTTKAGKKDIDRFLMNDYDKKTIKEVDWLMGSFYFCRTEALKQVGMFDERFFLYFEDTDLCKKFWQKKWKVVYNPNAKIIHNHGRQSAKVPWYKPFGNSASRYHIISWIKYIKKWGCR